MAVWIYSVESWPDPKHESGRHCEYFEVCSIQVAPVPTKEWFKLDRKYTHRWFTDYVHRGDGPTNAAMNHAKSESFTDFEVGQAIVTKYGGAGVVQIVDHDPTEHPEEAAVLIKQAEDNWRRWREGIVQGFNEERTARRLSGHGRLNPSLLELDSFRKLGLPEPGTLEDMRSERETNVKIEFPPEIVDLIKEGLAARQAKAIAK